MQDPVPLTPPSSSSTPHPACTNCETLQSHISQLSESVSSYESLHAREQQNKRKVFAQIETLENEVKSLKSQVESLKQTNVRRQALLEKSRLRQEEIISETKKVASSEVQNAKMDLSRMREEFAAIRSQLVACQSELDSVTIDKDLEIRTLRSKLAVGEQKCEGLEFRVEQNERDLKRANANCRKYRDKYGVADERRISLLREIRVEREKRNRGGSSWKKGGSSMPGGESWKGNLVGLSIQLDEVLQGIEMGEGAEEEQEQQVVVSESLSPPSEVKPLRLPPVMDPDSSTDDDLDEFESVPTSGSGSGRVSSAVPESELNVGDGPSSGLNGNEPEDEHVSAEGDKFPEMAVPNHDEMEIELSDDEDFGPPPKSGRPVQDDDESELSDEEEFSFPKAKPTPKQTRVSSSSSSSPNLEDEIELSDEDLESDFVPAPPKSTSETSSGSELSTTPNKTPVSVAGDEIELSDDDDFGFPPSNRNSPGAPKVSGASSATAVDDEIELSDDDDFGFPPSLKSRSAIPATSPKSLSVADLRPPSKSPFPPKKKLPPSDAFDDGVDLTDSDEDDDFGFPGSKASLPPSRGTGSKSPAFCGDDEEEISDDDDFGPPQASSTPKNVGDDDVELTDSDDDFGFAAWKSGGGVGAKAGSKSSVDDEVELSDEDDFGPPSKAPAVRAKGVGSNPFDDDDSLSDDDDFDAAFRHSRTQQEHGKGSPLHRRLGRKGPSPSANKFESPLWSDVRGKITRLASHFQNQQRLMNQLKSELGVATAQIEVLKGKLEIPTSPLPTMAMAELENTVEKSDPVDALHVEIALGGELGEKSPRLEDRSEQLSGISKGPAKDGIVISSGSVPPSSEESEVLVPSSVPSTEGEIGENPSPPGLSGLASHGATVDTVPDLTNTLFPSKESATRKFDPEGDGNSRSGDVEDPFSILIIGEVPEESDLLSLEKQESDVRQSVLEGAPTEKVLEDLASLLSKMKQKTAEESGRAEDLAERLSSTKTALTDSIDVGGTLASELSQMNQSLDGVSAAKSSLEARCADLEKALKIANTEMSDCRRSRNEIESKLSALEKDHMETCDQLRLEQASLKAEQLSRAESLQEIADLKKRIEDLEQGSPGRSVVVVGDDVVEPHIPTERVSNVSGKLHELHSERDDLRSKFAQAEMMIASLSKSNVDSLTAIADRASECKQLNEAVSFLRHRYTEGLDMASQQFSAFVTSTDDGLSALSLRLENLTKKMEYILSPLRPPVTASPETDSHAQSRVPPHDPFSEPVFDKYSRIPPIEQFSEPGSDSGMDVSPFADAFSAVTTVDHNFDGSEMSRPNRFKVIAGDDFSTSGPQRGFSAPARHAPPMAFDVVAGEPPPKASDRKITALDFDSAVRDLQSLTPP